MSRLFLLALLATALATGCDNTGVVIDSFEITSDSNGDGIANPGETVSFSVVVKNKSFAASTSTIYYSLSTDSEYATVEEHSPKYGCYSMESGGTCDLYSLPNATISPDTPDGTVITFDLDIDDDSRSWSDSFDITVTATQAMPGVESVEVLFDSNDDGVLNPGEEAALKITLGNQGTSALVDVKYTLSTDSQYVVVESYETGNCGTLQPAESKMCTHYSSYPGIVVSPNIPQGAKLAFVLILADEQSNTWTLNFEVPVYPTEAKPQFELVKVMWDDNDDGVFNPGESASLEITIRNSGTSKVNGTLYTLTTDSPYVSITDNETGKCGTIEPGNTAGCKDFSSSHPEVEADEGTPKNTVVPFILTITDEQENSWDLEFSVTVM